VADGGIGINFSNEIQDGTVSEKTPGMPLGAVLIGFMDYER
jgi:hypothetical protein